MIRPAKIQLFLIGEAVASSIEAVALNEAVASGHTPIDHSPPAEFQVTNSQLTRIRPSF
jgi:hypothetical protein